MFKISYLHLMIIIFNILLLISNIIYLWKVDILILKLNKFRGIDNFTLNFMNKTYLEIASYLSSKFGNFHNCDVTLQNSRVRKIIKICFLEFYKGFSPKLFLKNLDNEKFYFKFENNNPDYLIYSTFSRDPYNEKYKNAIKLSFFTENKIPNLNITDYAIGHSHLNYLDRYFKYFKYFNLKILVNIINSRKYVLKGKKRKLFCGAVISNNIFGDFFRFKFIYELNKYKKVDMGGKFKNNVGGRVKNKIQFLTSYKFSIAMENTGADGYYSEKIIESFLSGTIPIYYGDYMVDEYFNPKSFILIKGEKDMQKKNRIY